MVRGLNFTVTEPTDISLASINLFQMYLVGQCPVRHPITVLRGFLFKFNSFSVTFKFGVINSLDCLDVFVAFQFNRIFLSCHCFSSICISHFDTPQKGSGPMNWVPEPSLASKSALSLPSIPQWLGTQYRSTRFLAANSFSCAGARGVVGSTLAS